VPESNAVPRRRPIWVTATRLVPAPAERVYDILADYHTGHPQILPARFFRDLCVETGGHGDGTVIRFAMTVFGAVKRVRAAVVEPEPGRVLVERDLNGNGSVTTFTVNPVGTGQADVTIETAWTPRGPAPFIERILAPLLLRRIYAEELLNLEKVATDQL
jgi:hypothetical protein